VPSALADVAVEAPVAVASDDGVVKTSRRFEVFDANRSTIGNELGVLVWHKYASLK
jgi:hypothetical protein